MWPTLLISGKMIFMRNIAALGIASVLTGGALAVILAGAFWGALAGGLIGGVMGGITSVLNIGTNYKSYIKSNKSYFAWYR